MNCPQLESIFEVSIGVFNSFFFELKFKPLFIHPLWHYIIVDWKLRPCIASRLRFCLGTAWCVFNSSAVETLSFGSYGFTC
jgi:hypothetical protein